MKISNETKGALFLIGSAFLYSIMPVLIRILGAGHIPPISQVFLRYIVACLSACTYLIFSKSKLTLHRNDIVLLLLIGVFGYALTNLFFTYGILLTYVSNGLFIFYCYTVLTPVLGYVFLKEKANKFNWIGVALTLVALLLLFRPNSVATWQLGGMVALLSAIGQSVYLIGRKKLMQYSSSTLLVISTFLGVVVMGILAFLFERPFYVSGGITSLSANTWITTVLFGMDNFVAWLCMSKGFQYMKSSLGSILMLSELVFATVFAFLFFREIPTVLTTLGGLTIIAASALIIIKGDHS